MITSFSNSKNIKINTNSIVSLSKNSIKHHNSKICKLYNNQALLNEKINSTLTKLTDFLHNLEDALLFAHLSILHN